MALRSGCRILLLDEHTSALDPKMQARLMNYTAKAIATLGLTALMVTHKMDDAVKHGNRLIMLHKGRIAADVKGADKARLKVQDLLEMFHKCEEQDVLMEAK
jgi:putative ABC transport system ATP-binding protein